MPSSPCLKKDLRHHFGALGEINVLMAQVAALEVRLGIPAKTSDNSSTPRRAGRSRPGCPEASHPGRADQAAPVRSTTPNRSVIAHFATCSTCSAAFPLGTHTPQMVYEGIELPTIEPEVTRVHLLGAPYARCGNRYIAAAPTGLEAAFRFNRSVEAMVVCLPYARGMELERLKRCWARS